jgi:hypothetical protein
MVRGGGILEFNCFQPGIFTWGLVEMAMDTEITCHSGVSGSGFEK